MPYSHDTARLQTVHSLLGLPRQMIPRDPKGYPALDDAAPHQQCFQAELLACLLTSHRQPHPWEHPTRPAMASVANYLNWIRPSENLIEVHTNTACRVTSRLLPLIHPGPRISGIPGLRLIDFGKRRLRLQHLPTGARLDFIDSDGTESRRDMGRTLKQESRWHHEPDVQPAWLSDELTPQEHADDHHWVATPSTPLRSSLLIRVIPLKWELSPVWRPAGPGESYDWLTWSGDGDPAFAADLLTVSPARIPGASYHPRSQSEGLLKLGAATVSLYRTTARPRSAES